MLDPVHDSPDRTSEPTSYTVGVRPLAALALVLSVASWPGAAGAQLVSTTIDLGDGLSVRTTAPVGAWEPVGFSFGSEPGLAFAATFARAASGRIVAIAPHGSPATCSALLTDDRGEHWSAVPFPSAGEAASVGCTTALAGRYRRSMLVSVVAAFDPGSPRGVVTTRDGRVVSTDDEGEHWRVRRTATRGVRAVWVRGRTVIFLDASGQLWRSPDGGFALETIGDPVGRVDARGADLLLFQGDRAIRRVDARGALHWL